MKCISPIYVRKVGTHVPCGKCGYCIKKAIDAWCLRLYHEMEVSSSAYFITLTYNDEHLPPRQELSKRDLQLFIKRLRKVNPGIRYFAVGEYGTEKGRPHYHAVIFNLIDLALITDSWTDIHGVPIGHVVGDRCTMGRIRYMVEYMALPTPENDKAKPFRIMSRRRPLGAAPGVPGGIGAAYMMKMKGFHKARSDSVVYIFDTPNAMPRYYKDRIYNVHQRELVVAKAKEFSAKHPAKISGAHHDQLINKLKRKHR